MSLVLSFLLRYWKQLAIVLALGFAVWWIYDAGKESEQRKAQIAALQADKAALTVALERAKASERVVTKYIDRVKVVQGRTQTIIKEVPIYVPADSPDLPPGLRVFHDATAQGELPDPTRIADAAPVPAQDLATTVIDNYGICHANAEQVIALQDWIREQQAIK